MKLLCREVKFARHRQQNGRVAGPCNAATFRPKCFVECPLRSIRDARADYSRKRLDDLRTEIGQLSEVRAFPNLAIFGAGSFARLEASEHSDIDMFFLTLNKSDVVEPRTNSMRLFGRVIETVYSMGFPKFSNDCEYLELLHTDEILEHLGSRIDDHRNHFTARMLLLLESHCLYGDEAFGAITTRVVNSYFKDYPGHQDSFQAMFLLNDICRFWKTLLLNYENKRNVPEGTSDSEYRRTKQRVRNFKLKYSRMTTCFASVAALGSYPAPVTEEQVLEICKLTPLGRLEFVADRFAPAKTAVAEVLDRYNWFLEMTGQSTAELEAHFSDETKRSRMFRSANQYGDTMFHLLQVIDSADPNLRLFRKLVI